MTNLCVVGYMVDVGRVKNILHEVVCTSRFVYLEERVIIILEEVHYNNVLCLKFNVKAHVNNARMLSDFQTDLYERALDAFQCEGIAVAAVHQPSSQVNAIQNG